MAPLCRLARQTTALLGLVLMSSCVARELLDTKPSTIVTVHTGSQSDSNLFGILPGISQVATNISEVLGVPLPAIPALAPSSPVTFSPPPVAASPPPSNPPPVSASSPSPPPPPPPPPPPLPPASPIRVSMAPAPAPGTYGMYGGYGAYGLFVTPAAPVSAALAAVPAAGPATQLLTIGKKTLPKPIVSWKTIPDLPAFAKLVGAKLEAKKPVPKPELLYFLAQLLLHVNLATQGPIQDAIDAVQALTP